MKLKVRRVVVVAVLGAVLLSLTSCLWFLQIGNASTVGDAKFKLESMVVNVINSGLGTILEIWLLDDRISYDPDTNELSGIGSWTELVLQADRPGLAEGSYPMDPDSSDWQALTYVGTEIDQEITNPAYDVGGWADVVSGHTGAVNISEVKVGEWLIEWDVTGLSDPDRVETTMSGRFRGAPIDQNNLEPTLSIQDHNANRRSLLHGDSPVLEDVSLQFP